MTREELEAIKQAHYEKENYTSTQQSDELQEPPYIQNSLFPEEVVNAIEDLARAAAKEEVYNILSDIGEIREVKKDGHS